MSQGNVNSLSSFIVFCRAAPKKPLQSFLKLQRMQADVLLGWRGSSRCRIGREMRSRLSARFALIHLLCDHISYLRSPGIAGFSGLSPTSLQFGS